MAIGLSDNILNKSNKPDSAKFGPYANVVDACDPNIGVPDIYRSPGLIVGIQQTPYDPVVLWWWPGPDFSDAGLVPFRVEGSSVMPTTRVLWVQGGGQTDGNGTEARPFVSVAQALNYAGYGYVIRVKPGGTGTDAFGRAYYTETTIITQTVNIVCDAGVVFGGIWNVGNYGSSGYFNVRISGGEFLSELSLLKQSGGLPNSLLVENARFTGLGYFLLFGRPVGGNYSDVATLRNCYFDSKQNTGGSGPVQIFGRDDYPHQQTVELDCCIVKSENTACITFCAHPDSRVILRGTTEFRQPAGTYYNSIGTAGSGTVYPSSLWLVDLRPAGGGGGSYTDAQAIAAVLGNQNTAITIGATLGPAGHLEIKTSSISPALLNQDTLDLISGNAALSPLTSDTIFWHEADNPDPIGFLKNKVDRKSPVWDLQSYYGPNGGWYPGKPQDPMRLTPNVLNGYPVVSFDNTTSVEADVSTYNCKYYGTAPVPNPCTITFLARCRVPNDSSPDGKELMSGFLAVNYPTPLVGGMGPPLPVNANWFIVTIIFTGLGAGFIYLNGEILDYSVGATYSLWPTYTDGGTFRCFNNFTGDVAAFIVSREASRVAGRAAELYLNQKYNVY